MKPVNFALVVFLSVFMVGCDSFLDSFFENMDFRPDKPENMDTNRRNPYNDYRPYSEGENSLGFYSGEEMYISIIRNDGLGCPYQSAYFQCYSPKDTLYIYADILPYPEWFYGTLDSFDKYFCKIGVLILPDDYSVDGMKARIDGGQVFLMDQESNSYTVLSAEFSFYEDINANSYHTGCFEVTYFDLFGNQCTLSEGRFKLYESVMMIWPKIPGLLERWKNQSF